MKWFRRFVLVLGSILGVTVFSVVLIQKVADGPVGPIPGAHFSSGTEVTGAVDWSTIIEFNDQLEFELLSTASSRTVGVILHEGSLYIPCDLGFIWNRFPTSVARTMLNVIYLFKDWHEHASIDGRALIRKDGKLYRRQLTKVTDPMLLEALRTTILRGLERINLPVDKLAPVPKEGPRDIWFFRVDTNLLLSIASLRTFLNRRST